ncbi:MAG: hypothetical protein HLUCCA11_02455 [Phormidesmis priestleyi Ana]|uniref:Uncharacterized protein n=1 Tax=Phormidesmis priestleyi Ana TaxID=1666911 RepID=A0A0P7ZQA0_9CYAN|nr:MAG: hypothetical protein HLUCCA11_02455 [Phormidesmis priestleyi Ana]
MKIVFVGLAIAAVAIGGGMGYAGMQTSTIPNLYAQATDKASRQESANAADGSFSATSEDSVSASDNAIVIPAGQLNQMVTDAIASRPSTAPILDIAKDINTSIKNGRVESGATLNLSDLPLAALPDEGQKAIEQLTQTFPFLANRDVYMGIEGSPQIVDGALSLDDTHIKIGPLKLPIAKVANQLGISQSEIEQQIGTLLNQQGLNPSDVKIVNGELVIEGQ